MCERLGEISKIHFHVEELLKNYRVEAHYVKIHKDYFLRMDTLGMSQNLAPLIQKYMFKENSSVWW